METEKTDEEAKIIQSSRRIAGGYDSVYLQPKISVSDRDLVGKEALPRLLDEGAM